MLFVLQKKVYVNVLHIVFSCKLFVLSAKSPQLSNNNPISAIISKKVKFNEFTSKEYYI